MKKIITVLFLFFSISLFADYKTGKKVFEQKCASCHTGYIAGKVLEDNFYKKDNKLLNLKAPTVNMLAYFMKEAPEHIGEKGDPEMQRVEIGDFIQDYVYNPNRNNSVIPHRFLKYFDKKESMKGKVSQDELSNIADYLFEYKKMRLKNHPRAKKILKKLSTKELIQKAKKEQKIILIEAMSKTCYYCKKMEKEVLSLPDIQQIINKDFVFIKIDVDKTKLPLGLDKKYKKLTPTFFTLTPDGKFMNDYPGAWNKSDFLLILDENIKK